MTGVVVIAKLEGLAKLGSLFLPLGVANKNLFNLLWDIATTYHNTVMACRGSMTACLILSYPDAEVIPDGLDVSAGKVSLGVESIQAD